MPEYHGTATLPDGTVQETDGTLTECMEWADSFHWTDGNIKIQIRKMEVEHERVPT